MLQCTDDAQLGRNSYLQGLDTSFLSTAGTDFLGLTQEISFQSNEIGCINVTILKDGVDEVNEFFLVNLAVKYAPFDIPVDVYNITIIDSGELAASMHVNNLSSVINKIFWCTVHSYLYIHSQ